MTKGLKGIALLNPTTNTFTLKINSDNNSDKVVLRVLDQYGKLVEVLTGITPNSLIRFRRQLQARRLLGTHNTGRPEDNS
jgi:hypothetical protein